MNPGRHGYNSQVADEGTERWHNVLKDTQSQSVPQVGGPRACHCWQYFWGSTEQHPWPWEAPSFCVPAGVLVALVVTMLTKTKYCFSQLWKSSRWACPERFPLPVMNLEPSGCEVKAEGLWFLQEWQFYQGFNRKRTVAQTSSSVKGCSTSGNKTK